MFKVKLSKKKILTGVIVLITIATVFILSGINQEENKKKIKSIIADPELARAMTYEQFNDGDENIEGTNNVKFSAFFLRDINNDGYAEKIKGTCKEIGEEDTLYMEINVQTEGILKNGKIEINGNNFYLVTTSPKDSELKDNYISTNTKTIEFNDLNNGTQKLLTGKVRCGDYSYSSLTTEAIGKNINNLSRNDNKIIFTGTYIDSNGESKEIRKEIDISTDWYGKTSAEITATNTLYSDMDKRQDEANETLTLRAEIITDEKLNILNIKKNYVEGTIPQLNGYDPISVTSDTASITFNYDETTRKFTITREAETNETGEITTAVSNRNIYALNIVYPLEAYKQMGEEALTIKIPAMTYYEGYNNPNPEFQNPYKSNEAKADLEYTYKYPAPVNPSEPTKRLTYSRITLGQYSYYQNKGYFISKRKPLSIYNGITAETKDDNYTVKWYISKGTDESNEGLIMKETPTGSAQVSDEFIKTDSSKDSMENLTKNVGISFENSDKFLAEDGWIKVYDDETDELLATFTKENWGKYTKDTPYKFNIPVKHIRVETSETQAEQYFYVYCEKELDDEYITTHYTKEEFDKIEKISSNVSIYLGEKLVANQTGIAKYETPYSYASLDISKKELSTQSTEKNEILTIRTRESEPNNEIGWTNGSFLIKIPTNIIETSINNIEINNSSVEISSYELIENEQGKFIKICTEDLTKKPQIFEIKIDTNITPDPRLGNSSEAFELYASNEEIVEYYTDSPDIYDVNNNLNTTEKVQKSRSLINFIAPNSLLTNQTASNYDEKGTTVVSPQIADVKPALATIENPAEKTIKIGAQVKNNYSNNISEIVMLGKIPFEGNTYVLSQEDMNSTFTTKMTNVGIEVPEALQEKIKVYYSENETPDKNVSKTENGWKTADEITNWDNIKTFLIDFQDEKLAPGQEYTFYYTVQVPNGTDYNKKSYSHHGVYFSLETPEGKYRTQTEPNKLGIRIAEKYNLELQKYQTGKDVLVPGATYKITKEATDDEDEESMTAITNAEGKLEIQNLYAKRTYSIQEIKVPTDYELNTDVIKFIGNVQTDGSLLITKTQGNTKEDIDVTELEDKSYKVTVKLEDEAKAKLKIVKTEKDSTTVVPGAKYKLTGSGISETGRILTTSTNGEISIKGLKIGEEYTLEEVKATGYYLASPIKFTITNTDGTYEVNMTEGTAKENSITEENNIPTAIIELEDDKIPTYNLEISKIKRIVDTAVTEDELKAKAEQALSSADTVYLSGAKFQLYKNNKLIGNYTTDENGKITISGLYQYIDGKEEDAVYLLKEVIAPEGYSKSKDITFKVDGSTGELKLINTNGGNEPYTVDGNTVRLVMEDSPSFKLIKKDSETQETLANVKFAIYKIDDDLTEPATNSKGEIIGTKETIDGKEYYVVSTDSQGELTADLPQGMYKAVEVQANEKYDLTNATYYFGVGTSRESKTGLKSTWGTSIGGDGEDTINSVAETSDGGMVAGGYFKSSNINLGNDIVLTNDDSQKGMVIKYNANKEVEWAKAVGKTINAVVGCSDGGIVVGGSFSKDIDLGNGVNLVADKIFSKLMIIKYNESGECEWANGIGNKGNNYISEVAECSDGGIIVGGKYWKSALDLGNGVSLSNKGYSDGMIIKYNAEGEYEWAKGIGGIDNDEIMSLVGTHDGGIIAGGDFESMSLELDNNITLKNNSNENYLAGRCSNGIVIKYSTNGELEWVKQLEGKSHDTINSVSETSDGGIIAGGNFGSSSIDAGDGIELVRNSSHGIIVKYNENGKCEWAKAIGCSITSVAKTNDGGIIAGGRFNDNSLDFENGILIGNYDIKTNYYDMMLVKYTGTGEIEWAKAIGGENDDTLKSIQETSDGEVILGGSLSSSIKLDNQEKIDNNVGTSSISGVIIKLEKNELPNPVVVDTKVIGGSEDEQINSTTKTSDGGYVIGGYFRSSSIELENGVSLTNTSTNITSDGMIIKYNSAGTVEWAKGIGGSDSSYDYITSVAECSDRGIIAGGYFKSSSIDLGNGIILTNKDTNYSKGMIIKYNENGECEWAKVIGGNRNEQINSVTPTSDGGIVAGGDFYSSSINLGNGINLTNKGDTDGMIIKFNVEGEIQWAKAIGSSYEDTVYSVAETENGDIIVGGRFKGDIDLENGLNLIAQNSYNGMLIKYSANGEIKWAKEIGNKIKYVGKYSNGGFVVGGSFEKSIDLENGESLTSQGSLDGIILKYNEQDVIEQVLQIEGNNDEQISAVVESSDGGIIVGGYSGSSSVNVGNGIALKNKLNNDGMIIKYNQNGICEWAKGINGKVQEYITSVSETLNGDIIVGGYFNSTDTEIYGKKLTNNGNYDGMIIKIVSKLGVQELQELTVENTRKEFKITTDVQEIDGIKGGAISGEDAKPYEKVKYGDTITKEIKMTPDENYEIIKITINGQEYPFTANEDGTYTMPPLTNITEDKKITVTYSLKDNKITINKVDSKTKEKLSGAEFKLDQIEERNEPENAIGALTDNGQEYIDAQVGSEITGKLGTLTNNGTYYFIQNQDGTYTPTNSKTYQSANGGSGGKGNTTANSYIPIDLTKETGKYAVVVNASCSSEGNYDYGYATITENTTAPSYNSSTGRFIYISGAQSEKDYQSITLEGGKTYYLHFGYRKDGSGDRDNDQIVINTIKIYNVLENKTVYNFTNNNGKYESTNQGKDDTVANSYIPIDLTDYTGKYNLIVNAQVSSQSSDYGYVTITENTTRPSYNSTTGQFIYISGTQNAKDYTTVLQGGKMYYLHLGYRKDSSTSTGDDKFTVNSVKISLNDSELYHTTVETNSEGKAITQIPFGKYRITETKAPEGYWLNETPTELEFRSTEGSVHEFTIEDEAKAKLIVHHYIKGTTTKLAEDEISEGRAGDTYTTTPKIDLEKYELEKDETGNLVLPSNAVGTYSDDTTEVTYYYVEKEIPLTVHHYIEGTTTQVPLKTGETAKDQLSKGKEGESYTTTPIADENLSDEYELLSTPDNATGTYGGNEIIVTYYYKKVERKVTLQKYKNDGTTPLQGAKFTIGNTEYTTNAQGKIETTLPTGTYEITETEAPEGYKLPENPTTEITITKETPATINITNEKKTGTVTVHHYLENTTTKLAEDEIKTGNVGDMYATKSNETLAELYDLVGEPEKSSGSYIDGNIEVTYYYKATEAVSSVIVHHYLEGTTTKIAEDETIEGKVGEQYTTNQAQLEAQYELVEVPENANGIMLRKQTIVTYYYRLKKYPYTINYLEKGTNQVLHTAKIGEEQTWGTVINTADEVIEIDGYNYDSADKENLSISTGENIINIYYTKKNAKVTVHYYEENTTNKVSENIEINGKVNDDYNTTIADDIPSKYELVSEPENKSGKMTEEEIIVTYYFRKKATQVNVHYYEEGTINKLSEDIIIKGKVDDTYTTESATDVPIKYELVAEPENKAGTMTEDTIEVIYYYRVKTAVINIRYLEKETDKELAKPTQLQGKVDEQYQTNPKEIEGYQLVEHSGNEKGKFEVNPLTVTYYYLHKAKATVQYIDKTTGQIIEQSTTEGLEGDEFVTESKDFENYILIEEPKEKTIKMTKEEQIIKYYYIHISGGVIEKHIDEISGEVLANQVHTGNEGDEYEIPSRTFEGYDLVEDKLPTNAKGKMTVNPTEVIYYYKYKTKVTAEYIDKTTGNKLAEDEIQTGHEKDKYTTERKIIDGYKLIEVPTNADGEMTKENIKVTYYYAHTSGGVTVNHIDINTGKQLLDETKQEGYEGDLYETHKENIPEYDLVEDKYPENATGTMTKDEIRVTYYYIKKTEVKVKYIDKETGEEIEETTNIQGHEGDNYTTEQKEIEGYDLVEEPENKNGTMGNTPTEVIYYYKRPAKVIVNYYNEETNEKIAEEIKIEGHENDEYQTEQKDIKYYEITKEPDNKEGTMKVKVTKDENGKDIVENTTYVNYYYRKMLFNMKINKTIESITIDGKEQIINDDIGKIEIARKELSTAKVQVKYKIAVTNDSELTGKAVILEHIPSGMTMKAENNPGWDIKETTATRETEEMKSGETQEYQVILDWNNGENNIGTKENTATITTQNEAGFEEKDMADNEDKADIIVAVGTGEVPYVVIAGFTLLIVIAMAAGVYIVKRVSIEK